MSGIITLTSDFGPQGPFVAVMHGVILQRAPALRIVDLTHDIQVHWPAEAGFWLSRAYCYFPAGTVHVAVVDPGVGTSRDIIAAEFDGHVFLAPDNGLLAQVFGDAASVRVHRLSERWRQRQNWPTPSHTFHGRDIFAPLAADIATGRVQPGDIGPAIAEIVPSLLEPPQLTPDEIRGSIVTIDHFGNLITNIESSLLARIDAAQVQAAGRSLPLLETYGQAVPGDFLALVNSFGMLELACAEGNAADRLGLGRGAPVVVRGSVS
ncbi:MAG: SAM-dependent chlorinase/fluorinase [Gammaproteobacteria bacterium]|nr:SAM-dependent chlorinase/fluorinase [Gammaproteobacteria bacterium]